MNEETTNAHSDRILVVDDTTANLQLLTNLLTEQGYTVYPASDGELALEFVQSILPDLILLDIKMPGMDGFEVCRRLKADERTRSIPIVFISILEDERDKVKGFQAGAVDYITKPFQPEEVLARVRTHMQLRHLTVRLEQKVRERTRDLEAANQQLLLEMAERKRAEEEVWVSHRFLEIANRHREMGPLLREFVAEVRSLTSCAAVGIRILEEDGSIPYQAYEGFSRRFYLSESPLSIRSDLCMCINVIIGATDAKLPFYTEGGSFYMNGTTRFLATVSEEEKGRTRNVCNQSGYESVGLIPIRLGDRILGLIHVADNRENMVPLQIVKALEGAAMQLGTAIQRVWAEEALKQAEEKYRSIFEYATEGIFQSTSEGRYLSVNPALARIHGYDSPDELISHVTDIGRQHYVNPEDRARLLKAIEERGFVEGFEIEQHRRDGSKIWVSVNARAARDPSGATIFYEGTVEDITERKRTEEEIRTLNLELEQRVLDRTAELRAANKELADFSYSVSHDLRAPLRHVDGFLGLLQNRMADSLDAQSRRYMASISESSKRMGILVDSLLSFSRMRHEELSKVEVDLNDLVREAIRELDPEPGGRRISWHVGELPVVTGDRAMLRIVLVNLISNALKFTRPREHAEIEIGCTADGKSEIAVFVRDNGVGFDMAYADKLFGVFQRLHRTEEFEGTGIGLANVRRIISRHGGKTWAEGKVDQGATFFFALPQTQQGGGYAGT